MTESVDKVTPYADGRRRRLYMKNLTSVAILPGGQGANPEANMTFFKQQKENPMADKPENEGRGGSLDGRFPINNKKDLENAIQAFGRARQADRAKVATHIRSRARALGLMDMIPEEGALAEALNKAEDFNGAMSEQYRQEMDALRDLNATLLRVLAMTTAQKEHYDGLDDAEKAAFLDLDNVAKDAALQAKAEADPVVYKSKSSGLEFRKSDDSRMVDMAKQMDADREETIRLRKKAEDDDLTKRAENELAYLPGDLSVRKAILKQVDAIEDEATRDAAFAALKAQNAQLSGAFKTVGADGSLTPVQLDGSVRKAAEDELEQLAKSIQAKDSIGYYEAYEKASEQRPDLLDKAVS